MIDEKKLIEDLKKWTQDDLYSTKQFQTLVEAQPRIHRLRFIDIIRRFIK